MWTLPHWSPPYQASQLLLPWSRCWWWCSWQLQWRLARYWPRIWLCQRSTWFQQGKHRPESQVHLSNCIPGPLPTMAMATLSWTHSTLINSCQNIKIIYSIHLHPKLSGSLSHGLPIQVWAWLLSRNIFGYHMLFTRPITSADVIP